MRSARLRPSTSSRTMYERPPPSLPGSRPNRSTRGTPSPSTPESATASRTSACTSRSCAPSASAFSATVRPVIRSRTAQTSPPPPLPSGATGAYLGGSEGPGGSGAAWVAVRAVSRERPRCRLGVWGVARHRPAEPPSVDRGVRLLCSRARASAHFDSPSEAGGGGEDEDEEEEDEDDEDEVDDEGMNELAEMPKKMPESENPTSAFTWNCLMGL